MKGEKDVVLERTGAARMENLGIQFRRKRKEFGERGRSCDKKVEEEVKR
jgi:hypothetical protein